MNLLPLQGTGLVSRCDTVDYAWAKQMVWKALTDKRGKTYAVNSRSQMLHRLIYQRQSGPIPPFHVVDHRDGDSLNNQRCNLRLATSSQNAANRPGQGMLKGVRWSARRQSYEVQIVCRGRKHCRRGIATKTEAIAVYNQLARVLFGDFAWQNGRVSEAADILALPELPEIHSRSDRRTTCAQMNHYGYSIAFDTQGVHWLIWKPAIGSQRTLHLGRDPHIAVRNALKLLSVLQSSGVSSALKMKLPSTPRVKTLSH